MLQRCLRSVSNLAPLHRLNTSSRHVTTLSDTGIKSFPKTPVKLLPLLQSKESRIGLVESLKLPYSLRGLDTSILADAKALDVRVAFEIADDIGTSTQWLSSLHNFPSAWPRSHSHSTSPPSEGIPKLNLDRANYAREEEREAREADLKEWDRIAGLHPVESFYPTRSDNQARNLAEKLSEGDPTKEIKPQPQLWSTVQRLAPKKPIDGGITLFLTHANGFHKEMYEPTMQSMLNNLQSSGIQIAEIWSMDNVDCGMAGRMNADRLGLAVAWADQSRDMLQFLDYYMPLQQLRPGQKDGPRRQTPKYLNYPTELPRQQYGIARKSRKVVGVGHSFNGAGMMLLCTSVPDILDGVVIIDPVGVRPSDSLISVPNLPIPAEIPLARGAIARRNIFTSLVSAEKYLEGRDFFRAWDKRVLDLHLRYGFHSCFLPGERKCKAVTLSQSKWREALAYSSYFLGTWSFDSIKRSNVKSKVKGRLDGDFKGQINGSSQGYIDGQFSGQLNRQFQGWGHLICMSETDNLFFGEEGSGPLMHQFSIGFSQRATTEVLKGGHLVVQEQPDMLGARLAQILIERMAF